MSQSAATARPRPPVTDTRQPPASTKPTVWAMLEGRAGDDAQLENLAKALGWPCEFKKPRYDLWEVARHRLTGDVRRRPGRDDVLVSPWPDLVLIIGGRSVVAACRIRELSGGRTRVVCLGRPWAPLHWFDLVVTTPQYRLPARPNVLHNALPLNHAPAVDDSPATRGWATRLARLPKPCIAVLVGGNNGTYVLHRRGAAELAGRVSDMARDLGGSLLVATSPRTPPAAAEALMRRLAAPHLGYVWSPGSREQNPYALFLNRAEHVVVTSDSASMLADACSTSACVHLYDLPESRRTRLLNGLSRRPSTLATWRESLTARGLWVPRKDLTRIHDRLIATGRIARLGEPLRPVANVSDLDMTLQRIRALMGSGSPNAAAALARAS